MQSMDLECAGMRAYMPRSSAPEEGLGGWSFFVRPQPGPSPGYDGSSTRRREETEGSAPSHQRQRPHAAPARWKHTCQGAAPDAERAWEFEDGGRNHRTTGARRSDLADTMGREVHSEEQLSLPRRYRKAPITRWTPVMAVFNGVLFDHSAEAHVCIINKGATVGAAHP